MSRRPKTNNKLVGQLLPRVNLSTLMVVILGALPAACLSAQPAETGARETQTGDKSSNLFESRLPTKQGIPDITAFSQCHSIESSSRWQDLQLAIEQTGEGDLPGQVHMSADSMPLNDGTQIRLSGNVSIRDEQSQMRADEIEINDSTQQLSASGNVTFESQDAFFSAERLTRTPSEASEDASQVSLEEPLFYLFGNNANGQAEQINIDSEQTIEIDALTFSTCPIGEQSWQISASEMDIDPDAGVGEAWNTVIRLGDVPIFYLPYIRFPTDNRRESGVLYPDLKNSDKHGLDISLPIYWNIAENMDATLTPRHMADRGMQLGTELRLLTQQTYSEFSFEWLDKDKLLAAQLADPDSDTLLDANSPRRWLGSLHNKSQFGDHWRADINARKVSDSDYFRDFGSGIESANATRLSSELNLFYEDDIWQMRWFALSHQSLINVESYRYLPSWTVDGDYLSESGLRWQWSSEITQFEHKNQQQLEGRRVNILPSVSFPMRASWGHLIPKFGYQVSRYEQESQIDGSQQSRSRDLPIFSLDSGIYLDREIEMGDEGYTHSLMPRIFYTYIPFENQSQLNNFDTGVADFSFDQFWRENRFTGVDRVGDSNQFNLALGNSLLSHKTGQEIINLQLGRIFYLDDRQVQLSGNEIDMSEQSPWLAQLDWRVNSTLSVSSLIEWDETDSHTNRTETRINFEPKDNHIVNLSHRYRDLAGQEVEELDFSFAWPINDRWRFFGRWYNDLTESQTIQALAGIEYESCCWAIRLAAERYLDTPQLNSLGMPIPVEEQYVDDILLQFVFKGLGNAGSSRIGDNLAKSIAGYHDRFAQ